ncbi:carbohydrate porin, partial [Salmonella enterica subsp. enterica serovar 1,4,[5],12:i:-]
LGVTGRPFRSRPDDEAGVALATAVFGDRYRRSLGPGAEAAETALELTYSAKLTDWLTVQPDLQWVLDPSGDPALRDAWVVGVRLT